MLEEIPLPLFQRGIQRLHISFPFSKRELYILEYSMKNILSCSIAILAVSLFNACSARPIQSSSSLADEYRAVAPPIPDSTVLEQYTQSVAELRKWNEQAQKPSFALIGGFYQLPETRVGPDISFRQGEFFGGGYQSLSIRGRRHERFALTPFDVGSSFGLQAALNQLLDAGVRIKEISMADAMRVMNAENRAAERNVLLLLSQTLPAGADYLISIQQGIAQDIGPVWAGRVVSTKDGQVLAFDSLPSSGQYTIQPLLNKLIGSTLRRLATNK